MPLLKIWRPDLSYFYLKCSSRTRRRIDAGVQLGPYQGRGPEAVPPAGCWGPPAQVFERQQVHCDCNQMIAGSTVDAIDQSWFPCVPSQMNKHYNLFKGYDVFLYMKSSVLIKNSTWTSSTYTDCRLMIYWFSLNHSLTSNICISSHFFHIKCPKWNLKLSILNQFILQHLLFSD